MTRIAFQSARVFRSGTVRQPQSELCVQVASYQRAHGRSFLLMANVESTIWDRSDVLALDKSADVTWQTTNLQVFGFPHTDNICIMHNLPVSLLAPLVRRCSKVIKPKSATRLEFPDRFCRIVTSLLGTYLNKMSSPAGAHLLMDVFNLSGLQDHDLNNLMYFLEVHSCLLLMVCFNYLSLWRQFQE